MSIRTIRLVRAVALGCLLLGGCKTANTYSTGEPMSNVELRRIVRDGFLSADLTITAAQLRNQVGTKVAQLTIRNDGLGVRSVEVKWAWLDSQGINILRDHDWKSFEIQPGEVKDLQSSGPGDAADFRVTIRQAAG